MLLDDPDDLVMMNDAIVCFKINLKSQIEDRTNSNEGANKNGESSLNSAGKAHPGKAFHVETRANIKLGSVLWARAWWRKGRRGGRQER